MLTKTLCSGGNAFRKHLRLSNENPVPRIGYLSLSSCQWGLIDGQHYKPLHSFLLVTLPDLIVRPYC